MSRPIPARARSKWAHITALATVLLGLCAGVVGLPGATPARAADTAPDPIDLALYARLLEANTVATRDLVGTRVDYRALRTSSEWRKLTRQVRNARPARLGRAERLAFWINAYNILAIDLVLAHYPVESIRDIGSFFSPVWKKPVGEIEGRERSLGEIEHEILRKMNEPRIHAAIVCASTSCPSLARTPYRARTLDADLDRSMRRFLANDQKGVRIDRNTGTVHLSSIFDWFEADFEAAGGVLPTIAPYLPEADANWLEGAGRNASIRYFDYDWTLNDVR